LVAPVFVGFLAYLFVLLFFDSISQLTEVFFGKEAILCIALAYTLFEILQFSISQVEQRFTNPGSLWRIIFQFLLGLVVSILAVSTVIYTYFEYLIGISEFETELTVLNVAFAIISLGYNTLYFNVYFLNRENKKRLQKEEFMKRNLEYELETFKKQINPNFLYESLESLIPLIHHSPEQAEDLIDTLAGAYRYTLNSQKDELVPLSQETKALEEFVSILNHKYQNQISLTIETEQCENGKSIIPNTLQWLLQYIVKTTIINTTQPLNIKIYCEQEGYIVVENKLNLKLKTEKSAKNGFDRAQKSYFFFTHTPIVQVRVEGYQYIKIPPVNTEILDNVLSTRLETVE
jgi:sensor histidine kinase YesM